MPHQANEIQLCAESYTPAWPNNGRAAVVIAGAGARGAYEAGVLSVLLPALFDSLKDVLLLGTSAGAVNAALWAQYARPGRSLHDVGQEICEFWRDLDVSRVYAPIALSLAKRAVGLSWMFGSVTSLLDTEPLAKHCQQTFQPRQLAANIAQGSIAGVGLVATTCPDDGTGGRSHVFLQAASSVVPPQADTGSALDYLPVRLQYQHILASAAIPLAFPPVAVPQADGSVGYYTDGGVRLNTPIAPALDLDAKRLVIVSSHATKYAAPSSISEKPDVIDLAAQSVHSILADGLIEDLRLLKRINNMVHQAGPNNLVDVSARPPRAFREVPVVAVAPEPGVLAQEARAFRTEKTLRGAEYALVRRLFAGLGSGVGNDELLSYLLFNRAFANRQIQLGQRDAAAQLTLHGRAVRV